MIRRRTTTTIKSRRKFVRHRRDWLAAVVVNTTTTILFYICSSGSCSYPQQHGYVLGSDVVTTTTVDDNEDAQHRRLALLRGVSDSTPTSPITAENALDESPNATATSSSTTVSAFPEAPVIVPLHAHSGTHHVHVYVGSPPQRQTLIVDTGSRLMAFPCKSCQSCGKHTSSYFDPDLSSTDVTPSCGNCYLKDVSRCSQFTQSCIIHQKYTEGSSWVAQELEDVVWLGNADTTQSSDGYFMQLAIPYAFGCQTSERGLFRKQYADGILGLAKHETSLIYALHEAKAIPRNSFSLCFTRTAGYLAVGGSLPRQRHFTPMQYTDISRDHGWYSLTIWQVRVGDTCVACDTDSPILQAFGRGKGTILDSGTTDTYLPKAVARAFAAAWALYTRSPLSNRTQRYTHAEFETLPIVTFLFANNVTMTIEPLSYMEGVPLDEDESVRRVVPWEGALELTNRIYLDEPDGAVLGANAMFGYDILFDAQNKRIGLAKADCASEFPTPTAIIPLSSTSSS